MTTPHLKEEELELLKDALPGEVFTRVFDKNTEWTQRPHFSIPVLAFDQPQKIKKHAIIQWQAPNGLKQIGRVIDLKDSWAIIDTFPGWLNGKRIRLEIKVIDYPEFEHPPTYSQFELLP